MTIEHAKECLNSINLFAYGDEKNEYEFEEVKQAIKLSTKSLDMWDKVTDEIKERTSQYYLHKPIMFKEDIIHLIEKYKKEIEE